MTFGMILTAICVHYFLVPSKLIIGTISGLSIVLATVSESLFGVHLEVSVMIFVINAILLVLAYFLIGKEFGIKPIGLGARDTLRIDIRTFHRVV